MTAEDLALQRLLDEGQGLASPSSSYGTHPDQVYEIHGRADRASGPGMLVVVHGGYFRPAVDRTHARPMARALAAAGWCAVLAEYRRVPGDPAAATSDLVALDAHLRAAGHDVAAWVGHSAGGALVMWRVLQPGLPPIRAVALAPVADFDDAVATGLGGGAVVDWVGDRPGNRPDLYAGLDPARLAAADPAAAHRISIVHGDADATVPLRQTAGWDRTVLRGAHHFDVVDPSSPHWAAVLDTVSG